MAQLSFVKMHGLGNDFVVVDDLQKPPGLLSPISAEFAQQICARRLGVGCDQLLWLKPSQDRSIDTRMEILNPDGSVAEMCGNGVRAAAHYLFNHGPQPGQSSYRIETLGGVKNVEIKTEGSQLSFAVDMGPPGLGAHAREGEILSVGAQEIRFHEISMGNPHAVIFVEDATLFALERIGPEIERHSRFPNRTNVEIVQVLGPREILVRVWERGAGITLACGTGACASAAAAILTGKVQSPVTAHLPGGALELSWAGADASVIKVGPAEEVFRGVYTY